MQANKIKHNNFIHMKYLCKFNGTKDHGNNYKIFFDIKVLLFMLKLNLYL
jgi:hypothetical protein